MQASYTASDFISARDWVTANGGDLFPTFSAYAWFARQHRDELIESGELIIRRGRGGALIGPNFGRVAVEILQRQQRRATA